MVSFSCEACNETMVKKKVPQHLGRCRAAVTCIDCSKTFPGTQYKEHNQCMTEDQKYQGKLYKPKNKPAPPVPAAAPIDAQAEAKAEAKAQTKHEPETPKPSSGSKKSPTRTVKVTKQTSLKKLLKKLEKKYNMDKKQLLKELVVGADASLSFASR